MARAVAPSSGVVTNLNLSPGRYLAPGQAALTFIDGRAYWVSALLRENNLEHMQPSTLVEMVFDALPGRVFAGRVESIAWGLGGTAPMDQATGLLSPTKPHNDTRRLPVTLLFNEQPPVRNLRDGSQASIVAYAVSHPVMHAIAAAVIRLRSVLAYIGPVLAVFLLMPGRCSAPAAADAADAADFADRSGHHLVALAVFSGGGR